MVQPWVSFLVIMLIEYYSAKRCAQIQFMKLQIELLREKLGGNRVILSPEDRVRMLRAGAMMDHQVQDVREILSVKTYKKWLREEKCCGIRRKVWQLQPSSHREELKFLRETL
jgi:putative transposase